MYRTYVSAAQLPSFAKLIGTTPDSDSVVSTSTAETGAVLRNGDDSWSMVRETPRKIVVSYNMIRGGILTLPMLYSPLWRSFSAEHEGNSVQITGSDDGLAQIGVPPGTGKIILTFDLGWPETAGKLLTLVFLVAACWGCAHAVYKHFRARRRVPAEGATAIDVY